MYYKTGRQTYRHQFCLVALMVAAVLTLFAESAEVAAQNRLPQRQTMPGINYQRSFREYLDGDYKDAIRDFQNAVKGAYIDANGRFLDSAAYWSMLGESHYRLGQYASAVEYHEQALKLYMGYGNWEQRVKFPPTIPRATNAVAQARITWGSSLRTSAVAQVPNSFSVFFGRLDNDRVLEQGGVFQLPEFRQVNMAEIMRGIAVSAHRRKTIKGTTCKYDPFTFDLITKLSSGAVGDGTIAGAWNGVILGIVYSSGNDLDKATAVLKTSLQLAGGLDHPLTPLGLLELGQIEFAKGNFADAKKLLLEASYSGAIFNQYDVIEESLEWATRCHLIQKSGTVFEPLPNAIKWLSRERVRVSAAVLSVRLAQNLAEIGEWRKSLSMINSGMRGAARTDADETMVAALAKYVSALANFQKPDYKKANAEFAECMARLRGGSRRLYQLGLADTLVINGRVTPREADLLYSALLKDPTSDDWLVDPMETFAYLLSDHLGPMGRWFEVLHSEQKVDQAMAVADQIRRHRFYASLPLGGRLLSLRWVMEADPEAIGDTVKDQRKDLFARFKSYKQLSDAAERIRKQLKDLPIQPDKGSAEARQQKELVEQLEDLAETQESSLSAIALSREPSQMAFPPKINPDQFDLVIGDKQLIISCLATERGYYISSATRKQREIESTINSSQVQKAVSDYLKLLGNSSAKSQLSVEQLKSEEWKTASKQIVKGLFPNRDADFWKQFDEVIIIPDGILWYLPFESLQIGTDAQPKMLAEIARTRFAPTFGLAFPDDRPRKRFTNPIIVMNRTPTKVESKLADEAFAALQNKIPTATRIDSKPSSPTNLLTSVVEQLIVWGDIKGFSETPAFGLAIYQQDRGKTGSTLQSWMLLPWQGPDQIFMTNLTTGAATRGRSPQNGRELFLSSCGLMSSGCRTLLLSRWRPGGAIGFDITDEMLERLKDKTASESWNETIAVIRAKQIDFDKNERLKKPKVAEELTADHPFFWSGYMLIDTGSKPPKKD